MVALRLSCLLHGFLLLLALGCAVHRPLTSPPIVFPPMTDDEVAAAREFVAGVAGKMPLWDADAIARYERVEIATVKADIAVAQGEAQRERYLACVGRLHADWDALIALDEMLKKEALT